MALQTTGLKYTSVGVDQFIANVQKAASNLNAFTNNANASSRAVKGAAADLRQHVGSLNAMASATTAAARAENALTAAQIATTRTANAETASIQSVNRAINAAAQDATRAKNAETAAIQAAVRAKNADIAVTNSQAAVASVTRAKKVDNQFTTTQIRNQASLNNSQAALVRSQNALSRASSNSSGIFARLGQQSGFLGGVFSKLGSTFSSIPKALGGIASSAGSAVGQLLGIGKAAQSSSIHIDSLIERAVILAAVFGAVGVVKDWISTGYEQVVLYDQLQSSLQALIAREMVETGQTKDMAGAWDAATVRAKELTDWVEKLGVLSIFESQDISNVVQLAMNVGILEEDARALTLSIVEWGNVTKRTPAQLEQVTHALTDMFTKGRIQAEEMTRQLSNRGIPAWKYLADALGVTTAKAQEMVTKGLVPANVGIKAIVDGINKQYGGTLEKFSVSLAGLTSSLSDLRKISLRELFKPAIEAAMPAMERLVAVLQTPEVKQRLNEWGAALGVVATKALDFAEAMFASGDPIAYIALQIDNVIPGFFRFAAAVKELGSMFMDIAGEALSWGFNIGASLAEGVMQAATYIVEALSYIGSIIASWLAPGSPPKLLPELGEWGKGAGVEYIKGWSLIDKGTVLDSFDILGYNIQDALLAQTSGIEIQGQVAAEKYLKGWSKADMSMFKDLEKSIRDVLDNVVAAGGMKKEGIVPALLGGEDVVKRAIQELDSFGKVTEETMSKVDDWASNLSPDIREVVDSYIAWEEASIAVKDAQDNLTQINKDFEESIKAIKDAYDETLGPLNASLKANEKQQKQLKDQEKLRKLQETIGDSKSTDAEKRAAQLEIEEMGIRQQIDAVEERRDAEVSAAEDQKKAAVDAATVALEEAKKQEEIAKTAYDSKQAQIELQKTHNSLIAEQTKLLDAQAKAAAKAAGGGGGKPKPEKASFEGGPLGLDQGPMAALDEAMGRLNEKAAAAKQHWADLRTSFDEAKNKALEVKAAVAPLEPLAAGIGMAFGLIAAGGIVTFIARLVGATTPIGALILAGSLLYQAWQANFMGIQKIADQVFGSLNIGAGGVSDLWTNTLLPAIQTVSNFFTTEVMPVLSELATAAMPLVMAAANLLASIFTNVVVPAATVLWGIFKTVGVPVFELLAATLTIVFNVIADYILPVFGSFYNFISTYIIPVIDANIKIATELARILGEVLRLAFEAVIYAIETIIKKFDDAGKGVTILIDYLFGPGSMDYALDQVAGAFDYVVGLIADFTGGLEGIKGAIDNVIGWLKDLADTLSKIDIPSALDPGSPTPFEMGLRGITGALQNLLSAIALAPNAFGQLHGLTHDMLKTLDDISKKATDLVEKLTQGVLESQIGRLGSTISDFRFGNEMLYDLNKFKQGIQDLRDEYDKSGQDIAKMREEYSRLLAEGKTEEAAALLPKIATAAEQQAGLLPQIAMSEDQAKRLAGVQDKFQKDTIALRYEYSELAKEDPENAKLLYDLKSKQAQDLADLDRRIILAKTDEERANLIYERRFIEEQQGYEMDLFKRQAAERSKTLKDQIAEIATAWQDVWSQEGVYKEGFPEALQAMYDIIIKLTDLKLPDWLTPGSPTPLELGLLGINAAMQQLASASLPALRMEFGRMSGVAGPSQIMNSVNYNYNNTNQYNLGVTTNRSPQAAMQSFEIMRSFNS